MNIILSLIFCFFQISDFANTHITCRQFSGDKICIVSIKRSAKNYWEYETIVKINGMIKPKKIYDCHETQSDNVTKFICGFFKK